MVAGEGFEPTTSGLSLRAALPLLPFPGRHPDLPANGAAAEKAGLLLPPPAAQPRFSQRAPLVGLITRSASTQIILRNGITKTPVRWTGVFVIGCGGRIRTNDLRVMSSKRSVSHSILLLYLFIIYCFFLVFYELFPAVILYRFLSFCIAVELLLNSRQPLLLSM